jgi:hypothetical protein
MIPRYYSHLYQLSSLYFLFIMDSNVYRDFHFGRGLSNREKYRDLIPFAFLFNYFLNFFESLKYNL